MTTELTTQEESSQRIWSLDDLIAACDPDRDYGAFQNLAAVKMAVERGELKILPPYEGTTQPVIFDAKSGKRVKGSGVPIPRGVADVKIWARSRFNERAAEDLDEVYDDLIRACHAGDSKAMKLFFEMFLGQAPKPQDNPVGAVLKEMLDRLQRPSEVVYEVK